MITNYIGSILAIVFIMVIFSMIIWDCNRIFNKPTKRLSKVLSMGKDGILFIDPNHPQNKL